MDWQGKMMEKVQVLMSTYHGARYLPQQMDSILSQSGVEVSLLIRDDGSDDGTLEILRAYEKRHGNISIYKGSHRGAAESFYDLLCHADVSCGYYAFADQDDVWQVGKLFQAVSVLEAQPKDLPLLYAGKVIYASENLDSRQGFSYRVGREPSFGNALMENICMGCTEVFNRRLLELARGHLPAGPAMHDWWLYLTAAYFGKVAYDQNAYVLYRQHGDNAVGMQDRWGKRWANRIRHIRQMKHKLSNQAAAFADAYADLLAVESSDNPQLPCGYKSAMHSRGNKGNQHVPSRNKEGQHVPRGNKDSQRVPSRNKDGQHVPSRDKDSQHVPSRNKEGQHVPRGNKDSQHVPRGNKDSRHVLRGNKDGQHVSRKNRDSLYLLCGYRDSFRKRCGIAMDKNVYRQNALDDAICRILFIGGFL